MSERTPGTSPARARTDAALLGFVHTCLNNMTCLQEAIEAADRVGDAELAEFFRRAKVASRAGAIDGKVLLADRLDDDDDVGGGGRSV
ncbi:hypothetical protein [Rhodococcus sp. T7]|uniref:hypothetical protein n=1 Tax=Rhodococcus sp. T7 TaxID=627444 RepID=UPI001356EAD3|nr:hypothetical protein [Rhodococcus sp. T7]KAF0957364.1 hypothetical protein MLGJGCBP_09195 [Rhodococcus sp. T7]KAF0962165.1 hypothetical protein MLGJGCBP_04787 [Rhodococcus sp. T7]